MNNYAFLSCSFGMLISERSSTFANKDYRFGFNGQERDDEVSGEGNSNTAEFWQYDSRLGRRWNMDPKGYVNLSSYSVFSGNPIRWRDLLGDKWGEGKETAESMKTALNDKIEELEGYNKEHQKKIDKLENKKFALFKKARIKNNEASIKQNNEKIELAKTVLDEMKVLEESETVYNILPMPEKQTSLDGGFGYDNTKKEFNIYYRGAGYAALGHELKHAYQFEVGKLSFNVYNDIGELYDIEDEVEAFQRQFDIDGIGLGDQNDLMLNWYEKTDSYM